MENEAEHAVTQALKSTALRQTRCPPLCLRRSLKPLFRRFCEENLQTFLLRDVDSEKAAIRANPKVLVTVSGERENLRPRSGSGRSKTDHCTMFPEIQPGD